MLTSVNDSISNNVSVPITSSRLKDVVTRPTIVDNILKLQSPDNERAEIEINLSIGVNSSELSDVLEH